MNSLYSILVAVDVLLAIGIIGLILIQHGKGADVGAAFGSGASGTVFGSQGSASFMTRVTAVLATIFFVNSLALAYLASNRPVAESVIDNRRPGLRFRRGTAAFPRWSVRRKAPAARPRPSPNVAASNPP